MCIDKVINSVEILLEIDHFTEYENILSSKIIYFECSLIKI